MTDLLIELFSEEIPARMQARAAEDLRRLMTDALVEAGLTYAAAASFSTPRRLALTIEGLPAASPAVTEERRGPRVDAPQKAIDGFLRGAGVDRADLTEIEDKKGRFFLARIHKEGRPAEEIIAEALRKTIEGFPWPKSMVWGAGGLRWVRPLHRILAVLTDESGPRTVPFEIAGLRSSNVTEGHRFMAPGAFEVSNFDDYERKLTAHKVMLRTERRAETIRVDAQNLAFAQGLELVADEGLLREVAGLVEWPVVLMGRIAEEFLDLPPEVLQTSMRTHQKFFAVRNPATARIERYITVANRATDDDGALILAGNSKVLSARLADAAFFWNNDLGKLRTGGMDALAAPLADVTFERRLGTQAERIARLARLAQSIAPQVGADPAEARLAAQIAKADLSSEMVYEFPELQGIMGGYYAQAAELPAEIAAAAPGHYAPLGPKDDVPTAPVTIAVALADKLDMLTGFWAIDELPTGSRDPFALRRAALGVLRIITENRLSVDLRALIDAALAAQSQTVRSNASADMAEHLLGFVADRHKGQLKERGVRHDATEAAFGAADAGDLLARDARAVALDQLLGSADGENLVQGYKRAVNILAAEEKKDGVEYSLDPDVKFAQNPEETALFGALDAAEAALGPHLASGDMSAAMAALGQLRAPIDAFFEATLINADSGPLRRNRLCLLNRIRVVMGRAADFGRIEG